MASAALMTNKAVTRQRVLVVDDEPQNRETVGKALARAGFEPRLAATGEQGLWMLRTPPRRVDWLCTKTELPGLVDGWILADEFHQAHPGRPVLYAAASKVVAEEHGRDVVLATPVLPWEVAEVLLTFVQNEGVPASALTRWAA